jgi:hypothetical protein
VCRELEGPGSIFRSIAFQIKRNLNGPDRDGVAPIPDFNRGPEPDSHRRGVRVRALSVQRDSGPSRWQGSMLSSNLKRGTMARRVRMAGSLSLTLRVRPQGSHLGPTRRNKAAQVRKPQACWATVTAASREMIDLACHGDSISESGLKDQVNPKRHTGFMNPQIPSCNWTCCHGGSSYPAMFKRYAHAARTLAKTTDSYI